MKQESLYHAASALADAIADSCRDGAIDLALKQVESLHELIVSNRPHPPANVARGLFIDGSAA